jgi:hypothetical protein
LHLFLLKLKSQGFIVKKGFIMVLGIILLLKKIYGEGRQLAGKPKDFEEEPRGHGGIFIVIENFIIRSSLE